MIRRFLVIALLAIGATGQSSATVIAIQFSGKNHSQPGSIWRTSGLFRCPPSRIKVPDADTKPVTTIATLEPVATGAMEQPSDGRYFLTAKKGW
jgi:hypothetical protein